jgi:hypothetical protein
VIDDCVKYLPGGDMGLPVLRQAMEKKGGLLTKDEAVEAMQQENSHLLSSSRGQRGLYKLKFQQL